MQRLYIVGGLWLLLGGCAHTRMTASSPLRYQGDTATDAGGRLLLLGIHPRRDLEQPPFASWFDTGYTTYSVDSAAVSLLRPLLAGRTFEIFMGTWCPDSRREVPRMFKVLDACKVPYDHIRLVMVDYRDSAYKQSPGHEERSREIIHVPDLIVLEGSGEQGRIVESPVASLEKDLLSIAGGANYTPNYPAVWWLSTRLRSYAEEMRDEEFITLADSIRARTSSENELATYSKVLFQRGDTSSAVLVSRLNTVVFPQSALAYTYLGRTYGWMQDPVNARLAYQKALKLDPNAKQAKAWLDTHPG
jgi:hypothetical protein